MKNKQKYSTLSIWMVFFFFILTVHQISAGSLRVDVAHSYGGKPLLLNSLRYGGWEQHSVSRLSYLLSGFSLLHEDGQWVHVDDQFAYVDVAKRRTQFQLENVPEGDYKSLRFSIGVPKKENHSDPAIYAADHPLNPNLNQLHWNWTGGYIFLAVEGKYRSAEKDLKGFVYHLANDAQLSQVTVDCRFRVKQRTGLKLRFDVERLLNQPRQISFEKDGASTHSHAGDPIASALVANLTSVFSFITVQYPEDEAPVSAVKPLYLPEKYTPYRFKMSKRFPRPALPRDNPLLEERVTLGKKLFHDKRLSKDKSISCASCHSEETAFSDARALSLGVDGRTGKRNSMPLFNLAWKSSFFWDGRAGSLREQVLMPIQDHLEMDLDLTVLEKRLSEDPDYQKDFAAAFSGNDVTTEKMALALENFLLTLTSYNSKFDKAMAGKEKLSKLEKRGMQLFFTEYEPRSGSYGADCFHCHGGADFSDHQFHNNGITPKNQDLGRYAFTKKESDKLKFSTPSLRNLTKTAPYMHDGRFETIEEVVSHYSGAMYLSDNLDANLAKHPKIGLQLKAEDKRALVAFLKSLSE